MQPTLQPGDWLLVWRGLAGHRTRRGQRGRPALPPQPALPGQRAAGGRPLPVKPGQIVVARHPAEPQLLLVKRVIGWDPDGWWLESDNPHVSAVDSRRFGPVAPQLIEGRVLARYWPLRHR